MATTSTKTVQRWDVTFPTNYLGPFEFTEAFISHLPDGANVVFTCSGVEDPGRKPALTASFRGGRYISVGARSNTSLVRAARNSR